MAVSTEAAATCREIRATREAVRLNGLCFAAQALALGATLVTDNEREFRRVGGPVDENWLGP